MAAHSETASQTQPLDTARLGVALLRPSCCVRGCSSWRRHARLRASASGGSARPVTCLLGPFERVAEEEPTSQPGTRQQCHRLRLDLIEGRSRIGYWKRGRSIVPSDPRVLHNSHKRVQRARGEIPGEIDRCGWTGKSNYEQTSPFRKQVTHLPQRGAQIEMVVQCVPPLLWQVAQHPPVEVIVVAPRMTPVEASESMRRVPDGSPHVTDVHHGTAKVVVVAGEGL